MGVSLTRTDDGQISAIIWEGNNGSDPLHIGPDAWDIGWIVGSTGVCVYK